MEKEKLIEKVADQVKFLLTEHFEDIERAMNEAFEGLPVDKELKYPVSMKVTIIPGGHGKVKTGISYGITKKDETIEEKFDDKQIDMFKKEDERPFPKIARESDIEEGEEIPPLIPPEGGQPDKPEDPEFLYPETKERWLKFIGEEKYEVGKNDDKAEPDEKIVDGPAPDLGFTEEELEDVEIDPSGDEETPYFSEEETGLPGDNENDPY